MRYRKLDSNGDMTFGSGSHNYYINVPAAVAQAVQTRLLLFLGEWFLDTSDGTPWNQQILGKSYQKVYDMLIKGRITQTQGMNALLSYSSVVNPTTRSLSVSGTLDTIYGQVYVAFKAPIPTTTTFILNSPTYGILNMNTLG